MFKKQLMLFSLFITYLALSNFASAAPIVNGSFDTDLSGWATVTNGGAVQWDAAGKAVLSTGSGVALPSSTLVQGDDGTFSFLNPILLGAGDDVFKFDAVFTSLGADALEAGGSFVDNLQVWMYDANSLGDVLMAKIDVLTVGGPSFSFSLSPYIGRSVAFSFELNDENNGVNSQVTLDNIRIEQNPVANTVPLPGTLLLVIIGWFCLAVLRITRKVHC